VTFKGQFFGTLAPTSLVIMIGTQPCLAPLWVSDTEVSCTTPSVPTGGSPITDVPITVIVNGRSSGSTPLGVLTGTAGFRYGPVDCDPSCGYNQACDDATGSCLVCVPGWFGTKCDEFAIRFESANGQPIRVAESDGFSEENGELTFALRESPGANNPVTFQFATTLPNEVAIEPAEVTFTSDDFATPRAIRVRAVKDAFKDGNRTLLIAPTVVSGTGRFSVAGAHPTVRATTLDAFPSIAAVNPTAVPLAGRVNATIAGSNWDDWVEVWFESILVGEFRVARIISNTTGASANVLGRQQLGQSTLNPLATNPGPTRTYPPSSDGAVIVPVNKTDLKDAPGGYHTVTIVNVFANTRHSDGTMLYATEDCPFPGEFGRGKDCEPCPDGATCPGGYRIWPLVGYWNPGEGSGWVFFF
jgi:hypothetical protein